jgi:hypothetical protein
LSADIAIQRYNVDELVTGDVQYNRSWT